MGRREKNKFLRALRSKERKVKKKTGSKGIKQGRKESFRNVVSLTLSAIVILGIVGVLVWTHILALHPTQPTHNAFEIHCYIDETTFDVDPILPFHETWKKVYVENDLGVMSYTTATLEINRMGTGRREYFDIIRNVWADQIYREVNGVLTPQNRTYNIVNIARLYFEQTIPCYDYDQIGIEVKQFSTEVVGDTRLLKYHYSIAGTVYGNAEKSTKFSGIRTGGLSVQETMAQNLQTISTISIKDGKTWAC